MPPEVMTVPEVMIVMELEPREGTGERIVALLRSLRARAMQHPWFEGGMIWFCEPETKHFLVISYWHTLETWESFKKAAETIEVLSNMAVYLLRPLAERRFTKAGDSD